MFANSDWPIVVGTVVLMIVWLVTVIVWEHHATSKKGK